METEGTPALLQQHLGVGFSGLQSIKGSSLLLTHVTVNDGNSTTEGPVWPFTTTALAGDLDYDCDVDGADLALLIDDLFLVDMGVFAGAFGTVCP